MSLIKDICQVLVSPDSAYLTWVLGWFSPGQKYLMYQSHFSLTLWDRIGCMYCRKKYNTFEDQEVRFLNKLKVICPKFLENRFFDNKSWYSSFFSLCPFYLLCSTKMQFLQKKLSNRWWWVMMITMFEWPTT